MIRKLLATTAIATLLATGAVAQTSNTPTQTLPTEQQPVEMVIRAEGNLASSLIGKSVYNGTGDEAEKIGEVKDLVLSKEGQTEAIVVGVGGFLGIGQKEVALEYSVVEWAERDGDRWLVVETTTDALKAQEAFDRSAYRPMPADAQVGETKPVTKEELAATPVTPDAGEAQDDQMAAGEQAPVEEPAQAEETADMEQPGAPSNETTAAIDRSSLQDVPMDKISAENLVGTTVYGADDANIGEIGDVILTSEGDIDAIILDVGGFLGIGEKEVAVALDNLAFMGDGTGAMYLYTTFTKEELEAQPAYDEGTYADQRDEMRLQVR